MIKGENREQRIVRGVAAAYTFHKTKVIAMLVSNGATVKQNATNRKVLTLLHSFMSSNAPFAKQMIEFCVDNNYISKADLGVDGSDTNSDSDSDFLGFWSTFSTSALPMIQGMFGSKEPQDSGTVEAILALEKAKIDAKAAEKPSNAKYWIAGAVVLSVMTITGIIIYKKKR